MAGISTRPMSSHFMLLPSLACQAHCAYCFGPNRGRVMPQRVLHAALDWLDACSPGEEKVDVTFHGGEPLLAGKAWFRQALPLLRRRFDGRLSLGLQSNLWLLDDEYCALFAEHGVSIGTSLDGPEALNDAQRGQGYFRRTMRGIQTARRNGIHPGVICTFTVHTAPYYREILEFFAGQGLSFSVHPAVSSLHSAQASELAFTANQAEQVMVSLFDCYMENITRVQIPTFDGMARGLSAQHGSICTFGDCLGRYLTVAPDGGIFACNRFAHHPEWRLAGVYDRPTRLTMEMSPAWQKLRQRELTVREDCGDCPHFDYCKGGCPYNAMATGTDRRDSQCAVYRRLFDHIRERALAELFSDENLEAVFQHGMGKTGLMHKGRLLQVMKSGCHPREVAGKARETVAAVALACSTSLEDAVEKLDSVGLVTRPDLALGSLAALRRRLDQLPHQSRLNAYLHVTYLCNQRCRHCYARAGGPGQPSMEVPAALRLARQAAAAGFAKLVLTGGEPLLHPKRDELLDGLAGIRPEMGTTQIALRTNLSMPLDEPLLKAIRGCAGLVVVSLDGDKPTHDARRGDGAWDRTLANLRLLLDSDPPQVRIAATLSAAEASGKPGEAVRALAAELGIPVRLRTILPIGRGQELDLPRHSHTSVEDDQDLFANAQKPVSTCGLGLNLYIDPLGECYPCHAMMSGDHYLGNAIRDGMDRVLLRNDRYRKVTVDSNATCQSCGLRYLCGGFCRAWRVDDSPDSGPRDCAGLRGRASAVLRSALDTLAVPPERWQSAGLPLDWAD